VAALVLFTTGELLGNTVLRALAGFGLGALLVAAVPALSTLRPTISRDVHPDRVQRGQPAMARLEVRNTSGRRQPAFTARDTIGTVTRDIAVKALPPGGSAVYHYELPTTARGRVDIGPLQVQRADLLGLLRSRTTIGLQATLRVYPHRIPVRVAAGGRPRHHFEGPPPRLPMRGSMDLRSLREYSPGDELRHLHWKATARTGRLMVREYVDPAQPQCVVMLDTAYDSPDVVAFEHSVEIAAALVWEACERDQPTRLTTSAGLEVAGTGGPAAVRALLDALSDVGPVPGPPAPIDPARFGGSPPGGWFVFVTCSPEPARLARLLPLQRTFAPFAVLAVGDGPRAAVGTRVISGPDAESVLARWNATVAG
jgi:uncharacterized protein (DUF58 family)